MKDCTEGAPEIPAIDDAGRKPQGGQHPSQDCGYCRGTGMDPVAAGMGQDSGKFEFVPCPICARRFG